MSEYEPKIYRPCVTGLKCQLFYRSDYLKRVSLHGPENQGAGDIIEDLRAMLQALGSSSMVGGRDCTEACPIPGERSNIECPDKRLHQAFYEDLPDLIRQFEPTDY